MAFPAACYPHASPVGPAYVGPLDAITSKVLVAFATFRLFAANPEGLNVRRSFDSTAQDVGTLATGDFDAASFSTFVGGGTGSAVTVYDQKGANDATQATAGAQPSVSLTGINSKAALAFASGNYLGTGSFANVIGLGDWEFWCLFKPTLLTSGRTLFGGATDRLIFYCSQSGNGKLAFYDTTIGSRIFNTVLSAGTTYLARIYRSTGVVYCDLNGITEATNYVNVQSIPTPASFGIGTEQAASSSSPFVGSMMAAILFKSGLTAPEAVALTASLKNMGGIP